METGGSKGDAPIEENSGNRNGNGLWRRYQRFRDHGKPTWLPWLVGKEGASFNSLVDIIMWLLLVVVGISFGIHYFSKVWWLFLLFVPAALLGIVYLRRK